MPVSTNNTVLSTQNNTGQQKNDKTTVIVKKDKHKRGALWQDTNASFSANDIVATITIRTHTNKTITAILGELQTISYSIHQEKAPVRVLGNINPRSFVMGPRTIAGSFVFAVFNKHWMEDLYAQIEDAAPMKNSKFITDEIPLFDIVCSMSNEYGFDSYLAISGISIVNEGQVMSISDLLIENTYQYIATDIQLLKSSNTPITSAQTKREKSDLVITVNYPNGKNDNIIKPKPISTKKKKNDKDNESEKKDNENDIKNEKYKNTDITDKVKTEIEKLRENSKKN